MKKKFAAILTIALALGSLTGCSEGGFENRPGALDSVSDGSSSSSENTSTDTNNESSTLDNSSTPESKPIEKVTGIYGETEIPDIPCGDKDYEGKASAMKASNELKQCLYSMVFETHIFGDYKVSLVGDSVRTDKANFPGSIYTQDLRVVVEKNGEEMEGSGNYNDTVLYVAQFFKEYRLFEDKIGSYLDVYELENPVIAMRYFYEDDSARAVTKAVEFATIQNNKICSGFVGKSAEGTGVVINPNMDGNDPRTILALNDKGSGNCRVSIFAADEFKVIDGKTLVDEEAGIRYSFNFADPPQFELYSTEKIV